MADWTQRDLTKQFERVKKNGWMRFFKGAGWQDHCRWIQGRLRQGPSEKHKAV